jgi:hypothetical protein
MRRRLLLLSTLVALALALTFGIEAALAGNADPQQSTLTVSIAGTGTGRVISQPGAMTCPNICSAQFAVGTFVALHVTPAADSETDRVDGDCGRPPIDRPFRGCVVTLAGDTSIRFTFNLAPCDVPNAKGKSLAAAKKTIWSHHCSVGKITKVKSSKTSKGHVISQSPKAGKHLKKGSKVSLKVGE